MYVCAMMPFILVHVHACTHPAYLFFLQPYVQIKAAAAAPPVVFSIQSVITLDVRDLYKGRLPRGCGGMQ